LKMAQDTPVPPPPTFDEYKLNDVLEAAREELVKLIRERESIEWRINKLQNDIVHLAALCGVEVPDPIAELGLTDAVRYIFAREKKPLNITEIVEALGKSYPDVSGYKNLSANIHTIVRRLSKAKEIELDPESSSVIPRVGGAKYTWAGGACPPPLPQSWLKERMKKS
jgi:hypothetical protein